VDADEIFRMFFGGSPFGSSFQTQNGNTYKRVCYLGRTKILKNDHDVVYRIDLMSFVVKMLTAGSVIALFCFTNFMAVQNLIKIQKDRKRKTN